MLETLDELRLVAENESCLLIFQRCSVCAAVAQSGGVETSW